MILVTHGPVDHTGDVSEPAERTGATVLGPAGLMQTNQMLKGTLQEYQQALGQTTTQVLPISPRAKLQF